MVAAVRGSYRFIAAPPEIRRETRSSADSGARERGVNLYHHLRTIDFTATGH